MEKCTYIDGIASSEAIDTHGEVVDLKGIDCSSLVGAPLNWEHKTEEPSQIVGKILEYKKIFSQEDCENDRHLYYWNKIQIPFLYCMGRLFDDKKQSSKEVAALFLDDQEHPDEPPIVGFSIEGAKLPGAKNGMVITKSIARKLTITHCPANKTCIAQMMPSKKKSDENSIDDLFRSENEASDLIKTEEIDKSDDTASHAEKLGLEPFAKNVIPLRPKVPTSNLGVSMGNTSSGKQIYSHAKIHQYEGFSVQDHMDAANTHHLAAQKAPSAAMARHHTDKMSLHMEAANTARRKESRFSEGKKIMADKALGKSTTAGSGIGSPSTKTNGEALAKKDICVPKEEMVSEHERIVETLKNPSKKKLKEEAKRQSKELKEYKQHKSELLIRAEQEYDSWNKKEQFREFMRQKMPKLTLPEIDALGKSLALKKSLDLEKILSSIK